MRSMVKRYQILKGNQHTLLCEVKLANGLGLAPREAVCGGVYRVVRS